MRQMSFLATAIIATLRPFFSFSLMKNLDSLVLPMFAMV